MERRDANYQSRIYDLIGRMSKRVGVSISKQEYPAIKLTNEGTHYNALENTIFLNKKDVNSADFIGEEIGHLLRNHIRGQEYKKIGLPEMFKSWLGIKLAPYRAKREKAEIHTEEFFGYLGRKIIREVIKPNEGFDLKKNPTGVSREDRKTLKEYAESWRAIEDRKREHPDYTPQEAKKQRETIEKKREYILQSQRPYEFAEAIDLKKVNLKKLYALPNQEVRHRFFRVDPQYDLSKPAPEARITKRHHAKRYESQLETALKLIGTIGLFILFVLSINPINLTGYVINIKDNPTNSESIAIIILIILIIIAILNKFKSKRGNKK